MKRFIIIFATLLLAACTQNLDTQKPTADDEEIIADVNLKNLAKMFSSLPLEASHLQEVHDAVGASCDQGYDEEYTLYRLISSPGAGVGNAPTKATKGYSNPLRNLIRKYYQEKPQTKASVEEMMAQLSESDYQLYWPYSENWDGKTYPVITFDPGYGAESNYGFELIPQEDGSIAIDSIFVNEKLARKRPVWVLNSNTDAGFTPLELFSSGPAAAPANSSGPQPQGRQRKLTMKSFRMLRNYDSWFGGASEFMIRCGSADGFTASTEAELKLFYPTVTDFTIVVRRKDVGKELPFDALLVSDFTSQMENLAFLITEDDGGSSTSWKCQAIVKVQSKSYGIDLDIPYRQKDDIVWRGRLSARYFEQEDVVSGRFGDVIVTFELD